MSLFGHGRCWLIVGAVVCAAGADRVAAQNVALTAGMAFPAGALADRRSVGNQAALSISPSYRVSGRTVRLELTGSWFPRSTAYARTNEGREVGTLTHRSAMLYALFASKPNTVSIHAGLGTGVADLDIPGSVNPYGAMVELGAILGVRLGRGKVRGVIELQNHIILSDYGVAEWKGSRFIPLRVGFSVEPGG